MNDIEFKRLRDVRMKIEKLESALKKDRPCDLVEHALNENLLSDEVEQTLARVSRTHLEMSLRKLRKEWENS